jgi:hypothetical protein
MTIVSWRLLHGVVQYTDFTFAGSLTSSQTYRLQIRLRTRCGTGFQSPSTTTFKGERATF